MRVGVIGLGTVGRAVVELFSDAGWPVVAWDASSSCDYPLDELGECDFAVVCVGTPTVAGAADVSGVVEAVSRLPVDRVLLKSTVPPGTVDALVETTGKSVCFWPEYLGESRYYNPFFPSRIAEVPFVILGGRPPERRFFVDVLMEVLGPTKTYHQCSAAEAELTKYMENAYFATKITFVNEMRRVAEAMGVDWHVVREGWLLDPRVERMHTAAFAAEPGFGGKCLPKDLEALIAAAVAAGYDPELLSAVMSSNLRFRGDRQPVENR